MLLVIPTLNEEKGISGILEKAKRLNIKTIVIDGGSVDNTADLVKDSGIQLINVPVGKGKAFRYLISNLEKYASEDEHVLLIDGDGTYDLDEFQKLEQCKDYDMVIGSRKPLDGSFSHVRLFGNKIVNLAFSLLFMRRTPDLLSGYRLIKIDKLKTIVLSYDGFELETEITANFMKKGYSVKWVPVSYERRLGASKLSIVEDGLKILKCMIYVRFKES